MCCTQVTNDQAKATSAQQLVDAALVTHIILMCDFVSHDIGYPHMVFDVFGVTHSILIYVMCCV